VDKVNAKRPAAQHIQAISEGEADVPKGQKGKNHTKSIQAVYYGILELVLLGF
jgi:hypothetical protein